MKKIPTIFKWPRQNELIIRMPVRTNSGGGGGGGFHKAQCAIRMQHHVRVPTPVAVVVKPRMATEFHTQHTICERPYG